MYGYYIPLKLVAQVGFEPTTNTIDRSCVCSLTTRVVSESAIPLLRQIQYKSLKLVCQQLCFNLSVNDVITMEHIFPYIAVLTQPNNFANHQVFD